MRRTFFVTAVSAAILIAIAGSGSCAEKKLSLKTSVDKKKILIGDRIKFTVEATAPKNEELEFPQFKDYRMGEFEIKDSSQEQRDNIFGTRTVRKRYIITTYSTGKQTIPQIDIRHRKRASKDWSTEKTRAIDIDVASVLPVGKEPADIKDIKAPLALRNVYGGIFALMTALGLFGALGFIVYSRLKKYIPVRLPHETALEELESIRALFLQGGDVKEYYVGISDCIRRYIERAFSLKAPEMTTEEFLYSLRDAPTLNPNHKDLLKGFMNACDLVKFAKYAPTRLEAESLYDTAKAFIRETSLDKTTGPR